MQFLTVMGSGRKNGNTAAALAMVEKALADGGHSFERINIGDYEVGGCIGCMACRQKADEYHCTIDDDAQLIIRKMMEADGVILSSPLYCWGFTAQLKALIDRCISIVKVVDGERRSLLAGKRMGMLITAGGPYEKNLELLEATFGGIEWFLQCKVNRLMLPNCTVPEELGNGVMEQAKGFASEMSV